MDTELKLEIGQPLGLIYRRSLPVEYLKQSLSELKNSIGVDYNLHEIVVRTADRERCQKYGQFTDLKRTELLQALSKKMLNFYLDYHLDASDEYEEMFKYLHMKYGVIILIGEADEEITSLLQSIEMNRYCDVWHFELDSPLPKKYKRIVKVKHESIYK